MTFRFFPIGSIFFLAVDNFENNVIFLPLTNQSFFFFPPHLRAFPVSIPSGAIVPTLWFMRTPDLIVPSTVLCSGIPKTMRNTLNM